MKVFNDLLKDPPLFLAVPYQVGCSKKSLGEGTWNNKVVPAYLEDFHV